MVSEGFFGVTGRSRRSPGRCALRPARFFGQSTGRAGPGSARLPGLSDGEAMGAPQIVRQGMQQGDGPHLDEAAHRQAPQPSVLEIAVDRLDPLPTAVSVQTAN